MLTYGDTTFCASPDCTNKCNRQMPEEVKGEAENSGLPISYAYFCGLNNVDPFSNE